MEPTPGLPTHTAAAQLALSRPQRALHTAGARPQPGDLPARAGEMSSGRAAALPRERGQDPCSPLHEGRFGKAQVPQRPQRPCQYQARAGHMVGAIRGAPTAWPALATHLHLWPFERGLLLGGNPPKEARNSHPASSEALLTPGLPAHGMWLCTQTCTGITQGPWLLQLTGRSFFQVSQLEQEFKQKAQKAKGHGPPMHCSSVGTARPGAATALASDLHPAQNIWQSPSSSLANIRPSFPTAAAGWSWAGCF